jgi:hypothetical protein
MPATRTSSEPTEITREQRRDGDRRNFSRGMRMRLPPNQVAISPDSARVAARVTFGEPGTGRTASPSRRMGRTGLARQPCRTSQSKQDRLRIAFVGLGKHSAAKCLRVELDLFRSAW